MNKHEIAILAMQEINCTPSGPIFDHIQYDKEAEEIKFEAAVSTSLALENAVDLCRLFNLALMPQIENGEIVYLLM